jgi:hypothetical protein
MGRADLGLLGAAIVLIGSGWYIWTILRGQTRPLKATWAVFALVAILGALGARSGGAGPGADVAYVLVGFTAIVFLLSLHYGKPGVRRMDWLLGMSAVSAFALWKLLGLPPSFAGSMAAAADAVGLSFTLRETFGKPGSESLAAWTIKASGCIVCAAATAQLTYAALVYPLWLVSCDSSLVICILLARRRTNVRAHRRLRPALAD